MPPYFELKLELYSYLLTQGEGEGVGEVGRRVVAGVRGWGNKIVKGLREKNAQELGRHEETRVRMLELKLHNAQHRSVCSGDRPQG